MVDKIGSSIDRPEDPRNYGHNKDYAMPNCLTGIELEFEDLEKRPKNIANSLLWEIVPDGSLRVSKPELHCIEVRSIMPLASADLELSLLSLHKWASSLKVAPALTSRTGLHVHIDMRDATAEQLYNMYLLNIILERVLFNYVGKERAESNYCVPFYKSVNFMEKATKRSMKRNIYEFSRFNCCKYAAFNMAAIHTFGSVEYRHAKATLSIKDIKEWVNIIQSIKKYSVENRFKLDVVLPELSRRGVVSIMEDVFGELKEKLLYPNIVEDLYEGIRLAQDADYIFSDPSFAEKCVMKKSVSRTPGDMLKEYAKKHDINNLALPPEEEEYGEEHDGIVRAMEDIEEFRVGMVEF